MKTTLKIFFIVFAFIVLINSNIYGQGYKFTGKYAPISKDVTKFHTASSFTRAQHSGLWALRNGWLLKEWWKEKIGQITLNRVIWKAIIHGGASANQLRDLTGSNGLEVGEIRKNLGFIADLFPHHSLSNKHVEIAENRNINESDLQIFR